MEREFAVCFSRRSAAALLCGLATLGGACGGGGSPPDAAVADSAIGQDVAGPPPPYCTSKSAAGGVTDLSGTWVAKITGAEVVNAPVVGLMRNQTVLYLLLTIVQQGAVLTADGRYCNRVQVNPPNAVAPVIIPNAWAYTETPVHRTGRFGIGTEFFPVMTFDPMTEWIGWVPVSPADALPITAADPRLIDQDNDGNPGITIALSGQSLAGSIYSVQRQTTAITAIAVTADRVEGALAFTTEQQVLGSDPATLAQLYAMGSSGADPVLCNSSFVMVKVAGARSVDGGMLDGGATVDGGDEAWGCDRVRESEAALFAP
jgi:hypothetical protein